MMTSKPTPTRGVPIMLDRERHVRFPLSTFEELQEEFGEELLAEGIPLKLLGKVLYYGLKWEDPELTPQQADGFVDMENIMEVSQAIAKATGQGKKLNMTAESQSGLETTAAKVDFVANDPELGPPKEEEPKAKEEKLAVDPKTPVPDEEEKKQPPTSTG